MESESGSCEGDPGSWNMNQVHAIMRAFMRAGTWIVWIMEVSPGDRNVFRKLGSSNVRPADGILSASESRGRR